MCNPNAELIYHRIHKKKLWLLTCCTNLFYTKTVDFVIFNQNISACSSCETLAWRKWRMSLCAELKPNIFISPISTLFLNPETSSFRWYPFYTVQQTGHNIVCSSVLLTKIVPKKTEHSICTSQSNSPCFWTNHLSLWFNVPFIKTVTCFVSEWISHFEWIV